MTARDEFYVTRWLNATSINRLTGERNGLSCVEEVCLLWNFLGGVLVPSCWKLLALRDRIGSHLNRRRRLEILKDRSVFNVEGKITGRSGKKVHTCPAVFQEN